MMDHKSPGHPSPEIIVFDDPAKRKKVTCLLRDRFYSDKC